MDQFASPAYKILSNDMDQCTGLFRVKEAEAYGLLLALRWASDFGFDKVVFETDAKVVNDVIHDKELDVSEFGCLIRQCCEVLVLK